jgi:hypothetical protein
MYSGSSYDLFLQSLFAFIIIGLVFVPFMKWAFTSKAERARKIEAKLLKQDLRRLKRK